MSYSAAIDRSNPTAFLFIVDQSGSMQDPVGGGESAHRKSEVVADSLNRLLAELTLRCAREEGVRDYFNVGVLGYGATVGPILGGSLAGRDVIPISEIASSPMRVEEREKKIPDGAGGLVAQKVKFPVWVSPTANGGTPMCQVLDRARSVVDGWLTAHPTCFPPIVLHLTDGESTDGDPTQAADALTTLLSADGNVLLFNLHISSDRSHPVLFPDSDSGLPNEHAKLLFRISSVLPPGLSGYARQQGMNPTDGTRGFVFNADATAIVQFLDIGTRASDLR
ncbi:MAG TPA: vWA domain-containing protein [Candidatus Polarisedimenticolaceae bacterium]|nr:vWA domain-containing protein [Candidatus Polarisedimenticolaceae bacterium]